MSLAEQFEWFDERSTTVVNKMGQVTYYDHPQERWSLETPDEMDLAAETVDCGSLEAAARVVVLDPTLTQYRIVLSDATATYVLVGFKHQPPRGDLAAFWAKLDQVLAAAESECQADVFMAKVAAFSEPPPIAAEIRADGLTLMPSFGDEPLQVGVSDGGLIVANYGNWLRAGLIGSRSVQEIDLGAAAGQDLTLVADTAGGGVFVNTMSQLYAVAWETGTLDPVPMGAELRLTLLLEVGEDPADRTRPGWVPSEFVNLEIEAVITSPSGSAQAVVFRSGEILLAFDER